MQVELYCPSCVSSYESELAPQAEEIISAIVDEGPSFALGDGTTLEDELSVRLQDDVECPCCGGPVDVMQSSLGQLSLQLLNQW